MILIAIDFTPLLIKEVHTKPRFTEVPGTLYPLFVLYFFFWIYYGLAVVFKIYRASDGFKRNQLKYFFFSILIAFVAALLYFLCMFVPSVPPIYYQVEVLYSIVVAYAVIRYRLMDFSIFVRWGLVLGFFLFLASVLVIGSFGITVSLTKNTQIPAGVIVLFGVLILVGLYDPLRRIVVTRIDRFIYQSPDLRFLVDEIKTAIESAVDLPSFSEILAKKLRENWKTNHAGIAVLDLTKMEYRPFPVYEFENLPILKSSMTINSADFLVKTLESETRLFRYGVILEDEINFLGNKAFPAERTTFWKIRRSMHWLGAAVCVPILFEGSLIAFLVLGAKTSGSLYNKEDKKILSHIGELMAISVSSFLTKSRDHSSDERPQTDQNPGWA